MTKWTKDKIRHLRKNGFKENRADFAKRFRVTMHAVQRWEQGTDTPSGPVTVILDQLEKALEAVQPADLQPA